MKAQATYNPPRSLTVQGRGVQDLHQWRGGPRSDGLRGNSPAEGGERLPPQRRLQRQSVHVPHEGEARCAHAHSECCPVGLRNGRSYLGQLLRLGLRPRLD